MSIKDKIMDDIKTAMKAKNSARVGTLRFITSAIKNKEIEVRPETITEKNILEVLIKITKQRKDSIEQFAAAGRDDLVAKETADLAIVEEYLPEQMSTDKVEAIVKEAVTSLGATSMKDMGNVMKEVMAKTAGAADNKLVSQLIKAQLQ